MTQALRRKCEPWVPELSYGSCGCTLEPCVGWHRHWHPERWVARSGVGNCGRRRFAVLTRLTSVSRRSEPSAQTGGELHGVRTATARRGSERPVLGCGRRDTGERPLTVGARSRPRALPHRSPHHPVLLCPQILVGCADGTVKHFSTEEGRFQGQRQCPGGEGTFRGLAQVDG